MSAQRAPGGPGRWLAIAATAVVVATVATAFFVMDSPSEQREARLDRRRVADLARIARAVHEYARRHDALPRDLPTLAGEPGHRLPITDPKDGTPYAYQVTGARSFRLCAVFATDTAQTPEGVESWARADWSHAAGRQCFDREAAKDSNRD